MDLLSSEFLVFLLTAVGVFFSLESSSIPHSPSDELQLNRNIKITKTTKDNCTVYSCELVLPQEWEIGWLCCEDHHDCTQKLRQQDEHLNFTYHGDCSTSSDDTIAISSNTQLKGLIVCRQTSKKLSYTFEALGPPVTVHNEEDEHHNISRITKLENSSRFIDAVVIKRTYFVEDFIDVTCGASNILFHPNPEILLGYRNDGRSEVIEGEPWNDSDVVGTETTVHLTSRNVTEVICQAQRWETGEWEHAMYPLEVRGRDHIPIKRLNSSAPVVHLKGDERNIIIFCTIEGGPQPPILWKRDGQIYEGDMKTTIFAFGVVARIKFPQATYNKHGYQKNIAGEYILYAEDDGNNVEMCRTKIIIESKEPKHGNKFLTIMVVLVVALATIIVILLIKKKFKLAMSTVLKTPRTSSRTLPIGLGTDDFQLDAVSPHVEHIPPSSNGSKAIPAESFSNPLYVSVLHVDGRFGDVPEDAILIGECIGAGTSGSVYKGQLYNRNVAVKRMVNNGSEWFRIVTRELNILASIGNHPNIIELVTALMIPNAFGANQGDVAIVMEYCKNGDLKTYLRRHRPYFQDEMADDGSRRSTESSSSGYTHLSEISDNCVTTSDLLQWTIQFACGMDYLASQHIVHGDLALRNLLLTGSKLLKVSDFGLSKRLEGDSEYYRMKSDERIPWANCAPEFLEHFRASTATDIWAFGVAVWEMFTLGETPYLEEFDACSYTFRIALKNGHRLRKPGYANSAIYDIMLACWHIDPEQRPSFRELIFAIEDEYLSFVGDLNQEPTS